MRFFLLFMAKKSLLSLLFQKLRLFIYIKTTDYGQQTTDNGLVSKFSLSIITKIKKFFNYEQNSFKIG